MSPNSIQWRLQLWYGLLLLVLVGALGFAAWKLERGKIYRQIDVQLGDRIKTLADALNGPPPPRRPGLPPPERPPPPNPRAFQLEPPEQALFGAEFYYVLKDRTGQQIACSANASASNEPRREREIVTPTGEHIRAGRFIGAELAGLHRIGWSLAGIAGGVWLVGMAVGWLLVSRALRPIAEISAAAERISSGDLAQRINVAETQSELGRLATVLNSTFARLEAAFALEKRFAADAAHELRTPVSVLIAQTRAALNRQRSYEENLETIRACNRAAERMRHLLGSLLQLARMDAGQESARRVKFDLLPVASECAELVKSLAVERGVTITVEAAPVEVLGDPEQLHQVISNLLTNALQYNQPGGQVLVRLTAENGRAVLQVADTGVGISPADLPHIFERFYRADKARASGNAGLGLAISKAIIEAHGGRIEVASQEGAGTTFTLRF